MIVLGKIIGKHNLHLANTIILDNRRRSNVSHETAWQPKSWTASFVSLFAHAPRASSISARHYRRLGDDRIR